MRVLVVNAGSSSLKLRLLGDDDELIDGSDLDVGRGEADRDAVAAAVRDLPAAEAVGHRIVHGGERFQEAARIDDDVESELRALTDLAPLHQPKSLDALNAVSSALPDLPAVACFDTAFHATIPAAAATYALPARWRHDFGLRRYGFHGLSHAYASRRTAELLGRSDLRLVTCHLGAGASLAAVRAGRSVDTTMGFTPLEGLVMATRSGSVDPGLLLWLLERGELTAREMSHALEHESGLFGLAGTSEMGEVVARSDEDAETRLALDVYLHHLRAGIAAMAAALGGLDALAFTGGVGERSGVVRAAACASLGFLGIGINAEANALVDGDREITGVGAVVRTVVVAAREDLEIARQTRLALGAER